MKRLWDILVIGILAVIVNTSITSCIKPPLLLPGEKVVVVPPTVVTDMEIVWNLDVDWRVQWYYGWDKIDTELWGDLDYPDPTRFDVRRYFLGNTPHAPHKDVDPFTVTGKSFTRTFEFGYYDMLIWSLIDSKTQTQVVTINEDDIENVTASTTVTRSISLTRADDRPTALYNQPEIFYSAYERDMYISRNYEDYDYYDEVKRAWVKHLNCTLNPLVYIYMVQIIVLNNEDGRVRGVSGDCAISAMASGTSVNTGHTFNSPCMVYFNARMKKDITVNGQRADIIGGKLTTYGLCDMDGYSADTRAQYQGSRGELPNHLYFDLLLSRGSKTISVDVTEQCQSQCHGGVITVYIDAKAIEDTPSDVPSGSGSIFHPTVEDYDELVYDIPM